MFELVLADLHEDGGWVYLAGREDRPGEVKIGFTTRLDRRMQDLGCFLIAAIPYATRRDEQDLHRRFADWRTDGEWFRAQGPVAAFVAERVELDARVTAGGA